MTTMLYFGCWLHQAGHYLHDPSGKTRWLDPPALDCPLTAQALDGTFAPLGVRESDAVTALHFVHGWTVLAMWDRSKDTRPGSNAAFLMPGTWTEAQMWDEARRQYPQIVKRLAAAPKVQESQP